MRVGIINKGAESRLRSFFRGVEGDFVATETIFKNENRNPASQTDRNWFYNYNSLLKKNGLAIPLRGKKDGAIVTLGLTLTERGRAALKGSSEQARLLYESPFENVLKTKKVTLASWRDDAYELQRQHPELVIEFDVRLRKEYDKNINSI